MHHPRWFLLAFVLIVLVPIAAADPGPSDSDDEILWTRSRGSDWPTFLGPAADGKSIETGIRTDWSQGLPILWQREMGEGYTAPSVSRGRVFLFDRQGDNARLTCLNAETGEELWRQEYPMVYEDYYQYSNGPRASPVVEGDRVYTFGVEGMLRAHRVVDGELLWEVDTTVRFGVVKNFFGVGSTPAIEGDLLIAQIGGSPEETEPIHSGKVVPNGTGVVAFDKFTGEVRYRIGDELAAYAGMRLATIGGRRWGLAFARGGLLAFEPSTGKVDFHYPWKSKVLESVNASTPVVAGDRVLITETYGPGASVLAVRPGGYDVVWKDPPKRNQSLACHWATPIHHDGVVYASSGRNPGAAELRAVDLETGEVLWGQPGLRRSSLLSVDGHFVVLSEDGTLRLIRQDPEKYDLVSELVLEENGQRLLKSPAWNAPVLAHGILYVRGKDRVVALELIPE